MQLAEDRFCKVDAVGCQGRSWGRHVPMRRTAGVSLPGMPQHTPGVSLAATKGSLVLEDFDLEGPDVVGPSLACLPPVS